MKEGTPPPPDYTDYKAANISKCIYCVKMSGRKLAIATAQKCGGVSGKELHLPNGKRP